MINDIIKKSKNGWNKCKKVVVFMAQHTPTMNILHVLIQPRNEYIACPYATQRQNPCVNRAIKNLFIRAHEMDKTNEFFLN